MPDPFFERLKGSEVPSVLGGYLPRQKTLHLDRKNGFTSFVDPNYLPLEVVSSNLKSIQKRQDLLREFYKSPRVLQKMFELGLDIQGIASKLDFTYSSHERNKKEIRIFDNECRKEIREEFRDRVMQGIRDFEGEEHAFSKLLVTYLASLVDPKKGCEAEWCLDDRALEGIVSPQLLVVEFDHQRKEIKSLESLGGCTSETVEEIRKLLSLPPQKIITHAIRTQVDSFSLFNGMNGIAENFEELNGKLAWYQQMINWAKECSNRKLPLTIPQVHAGREIRYEQLYPFWESQPVRNNIEITDEKYGVLITGKNAGGKTSLLMQVGVAQILAQAGGFVPAKSGVVGLASEIMYLDPIKQDFQKEGSLFEQNILKLRENILRLTPSTLVLIDEAVQGTDGKGLSETLEQLVGAIDQTSRARFILATHHHETFDPGNHPQILCKRSSEKKYRFEKGIGESEARNILIERGFKVRDLVRDYRKKT